jgi:hypothetical protein
MQSAEIQIAAIDDVKRASFVDQLVEDVDIVHLAGRQDN